MADVELNAHFQVTGDTAVRDDVLARARAVEARVVNKMVNAAVGGDVVPGSALHVRLAADARIIYRMSLAMHAALADEGIVTYTGKIDG